MSILIDRNTRVLCQGITGKQGTYHAEQCLAYGTKVVAGVNPGRGGERHRAKGGCCLRCLRRGPLRILLNC